MLLNHYNPTFSAASQGDSDAIPGFGMTTRDHHNDDVNHGRFNKNARGRKSAGAFQGMGLSYDVIKGITKRGYKIPTPIQRKVSVRQSCVIIWQLN